MKRILRYLQGTLSHGLTVRRSVDFTLHAYSDSDWAGCPDDRRSTTGYCVYLGSNLLVRVARNSTRLPARALSLSIVLLLLLLLRFVGLCLFFRSYDYHYPVLLHYGVTTLELLILLSIRFFISV